MAILKGGLDFIGPVGNMSSYKRRDMEGTIVRMKGGASKKKIKTSPAFVRTRENNSEFTGSARAGSKIRWALIYVRHLADYNFTYTLNELCSIIQKEDKTSIRGQRAILLSQHGDMLEGFSLNKKNTFDNVVRHPLKCTVDRETGSAVVQVPKLLPDINIFLPWKAPLFRFVISLQAIGDTEYNYPKLSFKDSDCTPALYSEWHPSSEACEGERFEIKLDKGKPEDLMTMIVSVGIEMGMPLSNTVVNVVKYAGCAKILTVG
ncbi:hypothetical protein SAMN05518672_103720 [Chitinophaga sp. CF118]|uniref:hypothetical protein n=1 Tax=Chitinophaga sp. CF118 TaxID=1884367 RepID=UPI0008EDD937|nr:hypothetical protein [Chitinophaga sp. CF118]SFD89031.1 hypothetical protein SAMN05518672_103720 [Chitinophaga sp. CF118]